MPLTPRQCPPVLFRDVGLDAMARFLRGDLQQLNGPLSPITYLRTADYGEPYVDYGRIGRVMLLRPADIAPWYSGISAIYIARRATQIHADSMVCIPADVGLQDAERRFRDVQSTTDFVEAFGSSVYRDAVSDTLQRIDALRRTHESTEQLAAPLRRSFQSTDQRRRDAARTWMQQADLSETDLCTAWHHLSDERRDFIQHALLDLPKDIRCAS